MHNIFNVQCSFYDTGDVTNCNFINNNADYGGAVIMSSGNVTNCNFIKCSSTDGGAIYKYDDSGCNITSCDFTKCYVIENGGAIYNSRDGNCNVESCNFTDCHTKKENTTSKAAIYNDDGTLTENNCIYKDSPKPDSIATVIMSSPVTTVYNGNKYLVATLKDINNKTLSGFEVSVNLDGVKKLPTDENGQVKVSINGLTPKTYDVLIAFAGNENYTASNTTTSVTVNKDATSLTAGAVATFYNISKKLVVTLKGSNGGIPKEKITVKVGTISKTLTTNSKGQVSVDISTLVPKAYTASVKFAGDANYKASTKSVKVTVKKANTKLVASSKAFKVKATKKVTAILKDYKNRVIKTDMLPSRWQAKPTRSKPTPKALQQQLYKSPKKDLSALLSALQVTSTITNAVEQ